MLCRCRWVENGTSVSTLHSFIYSFSSLIIASEGLGNVVIKDKYFSVHRLENASERNFNRDITHSVTLTIFSPPLLSSKKSHYLEKWPLKVRGQLFHMLQTGYAADGMWCEWTAGGNTAGCLFNGGYFVDLFCFYRQPNCVSLDVGVQYAMLQVFILSYGLQNL